MIQVSVIITTLNEENTIEELLNGLKTQTLLPSEIVVVDGGSVDSTWTRLRFIAQKNSKFKLKLLQKRGNRSVGRNEAILHAKHELIAITDAGCVPEEKWLEELVTTYQNYHDKNHKTSDTLDLVVAGYYQPAAGSRFQEAAAPYFLIPPEKINPQLFLPATRSMLLTKKVWQMMGGFDEFLDDNEDYAFARKLRAKKVPIEFASEARVSWTAPSNLINFSNAIYRYAKGDTFSGIMRPKVAFIFLRYFLGMLLATYCLIQPKFWITFLILLSIYLSWSVLKNIKSAPSSWHYLPLLQLTSDLSVMLGSVAGASKLMAGVRMPVA